MRTPHHPGADLLDDLRNLLRRYVVFSSEHAANAVTLWIATTHALPAFEFAPRLVLTSPEKRCGKTRTLDIITGTCHDPIPTVSASVAAIYRLLEQQADHPPVLILDEADTLFGSKKVAEQNEDLRGLINAGHQRGRTVLRCVGPLQTPTRFATFAMVALAGIGGLPDTITDRAINVTLRRRAAGETVAQFRERRDGPALADIRDQLADWCAANMAEWAGHTPANMPVDDRAADTWEPLITVADMAGGHWPDTAREACRVLAEGADAAEEDRSLGIKLLADIHTVFAKKKGESFLSSAELVAALHLLDESPWADFDLNSRKLAQRLREYEVRPGHDTTGKVRGYRLEQFHDAFTRYLRPDPSEASDTPSEQDEPSDGKNSSDGYTCQTNSKRQDETPAKAPLLTVLTGSDAGAAGNGHRTLCRDCGTTLHCNNKCGVCRECRLIAANTTTARTE